MLRWESADAAARAAALARPAVGRRRDVGERVAGILARVRGEGDRALIALTRELDGVEAPALLVEASVRARAHDRIEASAARAIEEAIARVSRFHAAQVPQSIRVETCPGVVCERIFRPIERVGLYVPGGSAPLVSTAIMLGVPARIAGCPVRVLATPPRRDGSIDPHILFVAAQLGIETVVACGGAQAIAALAYGTQTVPKVDKIFGPGNAWVTEAKLQVAQDPLGAATDLPAGPSEVLVLADRGARADFVAADLLAQAEHGEDSQVILVTDADELVAAVRDSLERLLPKLPRRATCEASLEHAAFIVTQDLETALRVANLYAPEHLILHTAEPRALVPKIAHCGSVFLGAYSPESAGDYASGTNHVLPTYGAARAYSGLSTESFMKAITLQELSRDGARGLAPIVETLAALEGLEAHRLAMALRRQESDEAGARP